MRDRTRVPRERVNVQPVVRAADLETRNVGDELIVYLPRAERVHILNRTAADILFLCAEPATRASLAAAVCERYDVSPNEAHADVDGIVTELEALGLLRAVIA